MNKTLAVELQEQKKELLDRIINDFRNNSHKEVESDLHSYNDCAVIAKMWLIAAREVERYK